MISQVVNFALKSAKSVGSSKNDRINALGAVNTGFEAIRAAEQVDKLAKQSIHKKVEHCDTKLYLDIL